jgi:hypothetical protein
VSLAQAAAENTSLPLGVKAIAGALRGAPIDTSRDYDFTNWSEVDAFTDAFLAFALELTPQAAVA